MSLHQKNNKVLFGLISLLFIVTIVHSISIIGISKQNQEAGLFNFNKVEVEEESSGTILLEDEKNRGKSLQSSYRKCLKITHVDNEVIMVTEDGPSPSLFDRGTKILLNVKNICSQDQYIIDMGSIDFGFNQPFVSVSMQKKDSWGIAEDIDFSSGHPFIDEIKEQTACTDCSFGAVNLYDSPIGALNNSQIRAATIAPQETKKVLMQITHRMPWNSTPDFNYPVRVLPQVIRYFNGTALGDLSVAANEMKTYTFSAQDSIDWGTDYQKAYFGL